MKKVISVFLSVIMLISIAVVPVGAVDLSGRSKVPVVAISGDSEALYMPDGPE